MSDWKITARNYAAQAQAGLRDAAALMTDSRDAAIVHAMCDKIGQAVHFVMPDGGSVFDDNGRGLRDTEIHLPFPLLTIEYYSDAHDDTADLVVMPKRLIIAEELSADEARTRGQTAHGRKFKTDPFSDGERFIYITWAALWGDMWVPGACALAVPVAWDMHVDDRDRREFLPLGSEGKFTRMNAIPIIELLSMAAFFVERTGNQESVMQHLVHDVATEASVLIEFLEALSCSNVGTVIAQSGVVGAKAQRRAKDGKLPIFETRMLAIDVGRQRAGRDDEGDSACDRASPAQHLRRGHIRRLANGKNIWVQSCVVGAAAQGRIDKTYVVRA